MANPRHLKLATDSRKWAAFRHAKPRVKPDLRGANLDEAHIIGDFSRTRFDGAFLKNVRMPVELEGASFVGARMKGANFGGGAKERFNRRNTVFRDAHMTITGMARADFTGADFSGADLRGAQFTGALLNGANFTGANLADADFERADLERTIFFGTRFARTRLAGAVLAWTIFDAVDLSGARGLSKVIHRAPSALSFATFYRSAGEFPREFLYGAQPRAPEDLLEKAEKIFRTRGVQYWSSFISYAHADAKFVDHLMRGLNKAGASVWRDIKRILPHENWEHRVKTAITSCDRFIVVLSDASLRSKEVRKEMDIAKEQVPYGIVPVWLGDMRKKTKELALPFQDSHQAADFTNWTDSRSFKSEFDRLRRALVRARNA